MASSIESFLLELGLNSEIAVFIVSMIPIIELRGAIPFGVGLGVKWHIAYILSVIGNVIPVPFIILLFRPIIDYLEKTRLFGKIASKLKKRTTNKIDNMQKKNNAKKIGLFIFVAIPLPGTGAWTGAAIAALMKMRLKDSVPIIVLGVMCAGLIMLGLSKLVELFVNLV